MRRISANLTVILFLALVSNGLAQSAPSSENKDLPKLFEVNSNLYRGGQPSEQGVMRLRAMGVKSIINLRGEDALSRKEMHWAQESGMKYYSVSMNNWLKPKDEEIEAILALIDKEENGPVYVHCKRGSDRTGTVIAIYRITHDGWTAKQATDEAKQFGFGWWQFWMKDYVSDYYKRTVKENQTAEQN